MKRIKYGVFVTPEEGELIKREIDFRNISYRSLAKTLEMNPTHIHNFLHSKAVLTPDLAKQLYEVLGKSPVLKFLETYAENPPVPKPTILTPEQKAWVSIYDYTSKRVRDFYVNQTQEKRLIIIAGLEKLINEPK